MIFDKATLRLKVGSLSNMGLIHIEGMKINDQETFKEHFITIWMIVHIQLDGKKHIWATLFSSTPHLATTGAESEGANCVCCDATVANCC